MLSRIHIVARPLRQAAASPQLEAQQLQVLRLHPRPDRHPPRRLPRVRPHRLCQEPRAQASPRRHQVPRLLHRGLLLSSLDRVAGWGGRPPEHQLRGFEFSNGTAVSVIHGGAALGGGKIEGGRGRREKRAARRG